MVKSIDRPLSLKLGIHTTGNTGRKEFIAGIEIGQLTTTPLLSVPLLTALPLAPPTRPTMLCLSKNLGIRNIAIQTSHLSLRTSSGIQKKTVLVVERGHSTALVLPGALERLTIQRIGGATATATLTLS
jgi:hypothetical protein